MSKVQVNCQVCGILLYEKGEGEMVGVSSSFCPHCYTIYVLLNEQIANQDRAIADAAYRMLKEYTAKVKEKIRQDISTGKYRGELV